MQTMTDENICGIFQGAADFIRRELNCCGLKIYAYGIDGLIASSAASDYVFKPIVQVLTGDSMSVLFARAQCGNIYNCVAVTCKDLQDCAFK